MLPTLVIFRLCLPRSKPAERGTISPSLEISIYLDIYDIVVVYSLGYSYYRKGSNPTIISIL